MFGTQSFGMALASEILAVPGAERLSAEARVSLLVMTNRWPYPSTAPSQSGMSELASRGFLGWNPERRAWQPTTKAYAVLRAAERRRGAPPDDWIAE